MRGPRKRWLHTLARPALLWPLAGGCGLLVAGISLLLLDGAYHSLWFKLPGLFASELAFAIIIAVAIFVMLEEEAVREHSRSVLAYLYHVNPHEKFFKKIESYVLTQQFYRTKAIVTYAFLERSENSYLVRYTIEFYVKNVGDQESDCALPLKGSVDMKPLHESVDQWDDQLGLVSIEIDDEEQPRDKIKFTKGATEHCQQYELEPYPLGSNKTVRVKAIHQLVKHDHDVELWVCSMPTERVHLKIEWSKDLDLKMVVEAVHPEPNAMKLTDGKNKVTVVLNEPFLIHHGIQFSWISPEANTNVVALPERTKRWAGPGHD